MKYVREMKKRRYSSPARAIPISGISDRVGGDLVFGLPESVPDEYTGIIVMTDDFKKITLG